MNQKLKNCLYIFLMIFGAIIFVIVCNYLQLNVFYKQDNGNYNIIAKQIYDNGIEEELQLVGSSSYTIHIGKNNKETTGVWLYMDKNYKIYAIDNIYIANTPTLKVKRYQDKILVDLLELQEGDYLPTEEDEVYDNLNYKESDLDFNVYSYKREKRYLVFTDIKQVKNYNINVKNKVIRQIRSDDNISWEDYKLGKQWGEQMSYE